MSFELSRALVRGSVLCALSAGLALPALAEALVDQPVADLLNQQLQNFDQGRIGGYRQLWGEPDPSIDPLIRVAAPPAGGAGLAGALAGSAAPAAPQAGSLSAALMAARGVPAPAAATAAPAAPAAPAVAAYTGPRSCFTVMVVSGYGAYQSPRVCTRQAATREQLTPVLAGLGWKATARGGSSETYTDAAGQVATVFYAPSGVAVEVMAWRNVLNRPAAGAAPAAAVFAPTSAK